MTYDVIAVDLESNRVRVIAKNKNARNADVIENMAILRRSCDKEFFMTVPAGKYKEGDTWKGDA